jgi:hypothetical protein
MFIADVSMEYLSFRGVPLYTNGEYMVFVSQIPFHVDGVLESGEIISVPRNMVKGYKPLFRLHTFERFSILYILNDDQKKCWKEIIIEMFEGRGALVTSFLQEMNIEELLVFVDLWESGDILVEPDVIMHHHEKEGLVSLLLSVGTSCLALMELLNHLVKETKSRQKNKEQTFQDLKQRFYCLHGVER